MLVRAFSTVESHAGLICYSDDDDSCVPVLVKYSLDNLSRHTLRPHCREKTLVQMPLQKACIC